MLIFNSGHCLGAEALEGGMSISKDIYFGAKGFLFDPSAGLTYSLNKSGAFIFQRLCKGVGISEVVQDLLLEFEVEAETAGEDVRDFVQQLSEMGLLSGVP